MGKIETFAQFLSSQKVYISPSDFLINLFLTALLAFLLGRIFNRYSHSVSSRTTFSRNFVMIAVTTMIVIAIVKASLSLSLGLVGALSIVRFRTAIKEPEELSYIFYCIAIGLGFGADQRIITLISFLFVIFILIVRGSLKKDTFHNNIILTLSSNKPNSLKIEEIVQILKENCKGVELKRFDKNDQTFEASFVIDIMNFDKLSQVKEKLEHLEKNLNISFLNNNLYQ